MIIKLEVRSATTQVYDLYSFLLMAVLCFASGLTVRSRITVAHQKSELISGSYLQYLREVDPYNLSVIMYLHPVCIC